MILQANGEYPDQTCANVVYCCKHVLFVICSSSLNATWTVLLAAVMFSRNSWSMRNMTISHLKCHVARVIDDLLSFRSRPKLTPPSEGYNHAHA